MAIEVRQCQGFVSAQAPDIIYTRGLSNCIGLALFEVSTGHGHLVHTPMMESEIPTLEEYMASLLTHIKPHELWAVATGGAPSEMIEQSTLASREYTTRILMKMLPAGSCTFHWRPTDTIARIEIYTAKGTYRIETEWFADNEKISEVFSF